MGNQKEINTPKKAITKISVGICATNDRKSLKRLLNVLDKSPLNLEFLIVVSGSTDQSEKVANEFRRKSNHDVILIEEKKRRGKWFALNLIMEMFTGEILVLVPADVLFPHSTLEKLVSQFCLDDQLAIVSGMPITPSWAPRYVSLIWRLHAAVLKANGKMNSHATGELMAIRKEAVRALPAGTINDDAFLARYARQNGWKVGVRSDAKVLIDVPKKIKHYIKQRERVLSGHRQLDNKHGLQKSFKERKPCELVYPKSTTLRGMFKTSPMRVGRIILSEIRGVTDILNLFFLIILEVYISLKIRSRGFESYKVWERINDE